MISTHSTTCSPKSALTVALFATLAWTFSSHASVIFSDSFDYGTSDLTRPGIGWSGGSSTRVYYDADGGLEVAQLAGETGGALGMPDLATTQNTSSKAFTSYSMSNIAADGGTLWMTAIIDYVSGTDTHGVQFNGASSNVTGIGFTITSNGGLNLYASNNGGATSYNDTGLMGISDGTYMVLVRGTKGTGTSPTNSTVDIWFNPADVSSIAALGIPTSSTGADSKFGRDSQVLDSVTTEIGFTGAVDEIRLGTEFADLNLAAPSTTLPEPSTIILAGLGLAGLTLRRRREK